MKRFNKVLWISCNQFLINTIGLVTKLFVYQILFKFYFKFFLTVVVLLIITVTLSGLRVIKLFNLLLITLIELSNHICLTLKFMHFVHDIDSSFHCPLNALR
jgi:hypothetical protein